MAIFAEVIENERTNVRHSLSKAIIYDRMSGYSAHLGSLRLSRSLIFMPIERPYAIFDHFYVIGPKATEFSTKTQNNGHYDFKVIQGHRF